MQIFIKQKEAVKQQILALENENRLLQNEIDADEASLDINLSEIERLYFTLHQIGQPVEED
jgi:hypothetical protein